MTPFDILLPLPPGEGWGEGDLKHKCVMHVPSLLDGNDQAPAHEILVGFAHRE